MTRSAPLPATEGSPGVSRGVRLDPWLLAVVLVVGFGLLPFATGPLGSDDDYILHNLASDDWRDFSWAYNVDLGRGEGGATRWYEGLGVVQRRYVRVVPSLFMALEYRLFGPVPLALKGTSLALHLLVVALGYRLLSRHVTTRPMAAGVCAVVGLHPAAAECVRWFACQPILWATLAALAATAMLLRLRAAVTIGHRLGYVAAAVAAMFSYEAAIAVPLLLVLFDGWCPSRPGRRFSDPWATAAIVAAYPIYGAVALWNRSGTVVTDASYRAEVGPFVATLGRDLANYLVEIPAVPRLEDQVHATIGPWAGAAIVIGIAAVLLSRIGSSRLRTVGVCLFLATLSPPLLTRAAVSVMNFPTLRQLYLPLAAVALLLCAWRRSGLGRVGAALLGLALVARFASNGIGPSGFVPDPVGERHALAGAALGRLLAGADEAATIIQVGESECGYSLHYHADGREVWPLIPPIHGAGVPRLRAVDDRTLEVVAPHGRSIAVATEVERDPRRAKLVPAVLRRSVQRLGPATAHSPERVGDRVVAFRLTLDRPLRDYVFVRTSGCVELERWRPRPAAGFPTDRVALRRRSRSGPVAVEIVGGNGRYQLLRGGRPYVIKGAGMDSGDIASLAAHGGNSFRTWRTHWDFRTGKQFLDEAERHGLTVALGLDIGRERLGFDYDDEEAVARQLEWARGEVSKFKDHPALLVWIIGNEVNLHFRNPKVFDAIDDISEMIHEVDGRHPTTTALTGFNAELAALVAARAPDLDFLSVQMYQDVLNLPRYMKEAGFDRPLFITEWGTAGHWEVPETGWGAPIEPNSTEKARHYFDHHRSVVGADPGRIIGSYVFLWGQKQERTPTWYGMFLADGAETEAVDVMHHVWNGDWPDDRAPRIEAMSLDDMTADREPQVPPRAVARARVVARDPDGGALDYRWEVMRESRSTEVGGDPEIVPAALPGAAAVERRAEVGILTPHEPGAYRLFVYVYDADGNAGHANIPFRVSNALPGLKTAERTARR